MPGVLAELAAHLVDHRLGRAAHGGHRHAAEQEGQQAAEQQADHDVGVGEVEGDRAQAGEEASPASALAEKNFRSWV